MTIASTFGFALRPAALVAALAVTALTPPATAQDKTISDLFTLPQPDAPGVSGGTPQLEGIFSADDMRSSLQQKLEVFESQGFMDPRIGDLSQYSDSTIKGLFDFLGKDGDPCQQATRAALYLDAHLEEADWMEVAKGFERVPELIANTAMTLWGADELGFIDKDGYTTEYIITRIRAVDKILDGYSIVQDFRKHYVQSPLVRNGIWTNEIVEASRTADWTPAQIDTHRTELLDLAQESIREMGRRQTEIDTGLRIIELRYQGEVAEAELQWRETYDAIQTRAGRKPGQPAKIIQGSGYETELNNASVKRQQAITAAGARRASEHSKLLERSYTRMAEAQFATEKALAQRDALGRYSAPMARGDCSDIRRDGPIAKPTKKPDTVSAVLKLPHDKLMIFLESIGAHPSLDMMNCVCRRAGYGSSSTSQFYHPDTIGTFDKRYSCQHPGPPCIVSGLGCGRHPLPSDKTIWETCGEATGENISAAIVSAVKARQGND